MLSYKKSLKHTYLTVDDLKKAEIAIIGHCQNNSFQEEISALRRKDSVKKSSRLFGLNPQLEEGILRVGGRLSRASMPAEAKHPMIIPKNHHVADFILQDAHECLGHSGRNPSCLTYAKGTGSLMLLHQSEECCLGVLPVEDNMVHQVHK